MKRITIMLVLLGIVAISVCAYVYCSLPGGGAIAKNSGFTDEKFLVLLFPVEANTSCRRAVIASLSEYNREFLEIYADGVAVTVPKSGFTPVPPQDYGAYVEKLNKELDVWGTETDWSKVEYALTRSEGEDKAIVTVRDKSGTICAYTYLLRGSSIHPVDMRTQVNIPKKMSQ